ncbi:MAG TPA: transposase, partial [Polyangiaceae bacterium]|nr:transposase [Polyangiaceae bacterium]HET9960497.1 transposase [Polyangiaceae bacterium]
VFDRLAAHKTVATRLAGDKRFEFVFLPAYAPQLNPDEWVWRYAKHTLLGGCCPWGYDDLQNAVHSALSSFKSHSDLLASFFRGARLSL